MLLSIFRAKDRTNVLRNCAKYRTDIVLSSNGSIGRVQGCLWGSSSYTLTEFTRTSVLPFRVRYVYLSSAESLIISTIVLVLNEAFIRQCYFNCHIYDTLMRVT